MKRLALAVIGIIVLVLSVVGISGLVTKLPGEALTPAGTKRNTAVYVTMRGGVKIAVDVWLPQDYKKDEKLPALIHMTRYWRANDLGFLGRALKGLGLYRINTLKMEDRLFNEEGYVVVRVDARGSGASFGQREVEWSPAEISDYGEVLDWIVRQPWSNGRVGSFGVSYNGNTAELITINRHPALKAAAPLYGDYDPQNGLIQPGGVKNRYTSMWSDEVAHMDRGEICALAQVRGIKCFFFKRLIPGVKPIDGENGRILRRQALADHTHPTAQYRFSSVTFKDDKLKDTEYTLAALSPYGLKEKIVAAKVPMHLWLGWMDAATVDGALQRFLSFDNYQSLVIGPYTHGGDFDTDPFAATDKAVEPSSEEQYRSIARDFFDCYLKEQSSCSERHLKSYIRYFTMGERVWHTTEVWPPRGLERTAFYFGRASTLGESRPEAQSAGDIYRVDFSHDSGARTRWHTNMGGDDVVYSDRAEQDKKLLTYTSAPLPKALEITGSPILDLYVSSSAADGNFFAYLEAVSPQGEVKYLTEGTLRGISRKTAPCASADIERAFGFCRSFTRADAEPLPVGKPVELKISLFSTSVVIPKGYRLRVALAGADKTMFIRLPEQGEVTWEVFRDVDKPSAISLPIRWRD